MSEQVQDKAPEYELSAEDIKQANAGDVHGIADRYADAHGGYYTSEEDSEEGFAANMALDDQAYNHAKQVQQKVDSMYEEAYAQNEQHDAAGGEK